jgi:hypothetical protein
MSVILISELALACMRCVSVEKEERVMRRSRGCGEINSASRVSSMMPHCVYEMLCNFKKITCMVLGVSLLELRVGKALGCWACHAASYTGCTSIDADPFIFE